MSLVSPISAPHCLVKIWSRFGNYLVWKTVFTSITTRIRVRDAQLISGRTASHQRLLPYSKTCYWHSAHRPLVVDAMTNKTVAESKIDYPNIRGIHQLKLDKKREWRPNTWSPLSIHITCLLNGSDKPVFFMVIALR